MTALGLDLSLTGTGFCVLNERFEKLSSGVIRAKKLAGVARLVFIQEGVASLCVSYHPERVAVEGYAFSRNGAYSHELGELGGVIKIMLHRSGFPTTIIGPSTLKKYAAGKGNAKKNEILLAVYKKWGVEFHDDNEADAYALARMALEVKSLTS